MEEILASIRRIISEDDPGEAAAPAAAAETASHEAEDLMVFEDEFEEAEEAAPARAASPAPITPAPAAQAAAVPAEALVSDTARSATADAFSRLSGALRIAEVSGQTLEGVVRELLRPMMKEWLDANLPAIVEAKVEAELNRIARLSR